MNEQQRTKPWDLVRLLTLVAAKQVWFNVHRGRVVHEVVSRSDSCVRFRAVRDTSYLSAYLRWRDSIICWEALDDRRTRVTSSVLSQRKLDPAWYFGPLQRFYVGKAADVLIDALALPVEEPVERPVGTQARKA